MLFPGDGDFVGYQRSDAKGALEPAEPVAKKRAVAVAASGQRKAPTCRVCGKPRKGHPIRKCVDGDGDDSDE